MLLHKNFTYHKLKVNDPCFLNYKGKVVKVVLVRSSGRGFNFVDYFTNEMLFKTHFYPVEIERDVATLFTFFMPKNFIANVSHYISYADKLDKFLLECVNKPRVDILYDWVKRGDVDLKEFKYLLQFI